MFFVCFDRFLDFVALFVVVQFELFELFVVVLFVESRAGKRQWFLGRWMGGATRGAG